MSSNLDSATPIVDSNMIANLNLMAQSDSELYNIMSKVVKKTATPDEVEIFKLKMEMASNLSPEDVAAFKNMTVSAKENDKKVELSFTYDLDMATRVMYKAFDNDPCNEYLMRKFFNIPVKEYCSTYRIHAAMHMINAHFYDNGAEIVQANNFHAAAIWTAPGKSVNIKRTNDETFNKVFFDDLAEVKARVIPKGIDYFYLFVIGRDPTDEVTKGSVRAIFEYYKNRADEGNHAMVLEAINEHAKCVYEYFGFRNYKTFHYGVNEVDSKGKPDPKGEGFTGYLMIYHKDADRIFNK